MGGLVQSDLVAMQWLWTGANLDDDQRRLIREIANRAPNETSGDEIKLATGWSGPKLGSVSSSIRKIIYAYYGRGYPFPWEYHGSERGAPARYRMTDEIAAVVNPPAPGQAIL